jgi:beta-lactamase class A
LSPLDLDIESALKLTMPYLFAFFLFVFIAVPAHAGGRAPSKEFSLKIAKLESERSGRLGVAVISTNAQPLFSYRANERFAMCSTFKSLLGALVLSRVDTELESGDRRIFYTSKDILDYAPITKEHLTIGHMTVSELNAASIQYSDNTAANLLLGVVGGPVALTRYLRSIGDNTTRLDRNEPSLNTNLPGDHRDTSTPNAMAYTWQKLLIGKALSASSKEQLKNLLIANTTGNAKLRAGFDKQWIVGDKTGSGENGASNDIAIVFPKADPPFIIAVFYTGSSGSSDEKNAVIAEVARITGESLYK